MARSSQSTTRQPSAAGHRPGPENSCRQCERAFQPVGLGACPTSASSPRSSPPATSRRRSSGWPTGSRAASAARRCWASRAPGRPSRWPRPSSGTRSRRSSWPTTRRWPPSCTREFREFFPDNAVEYFVSYFDYYQPEAYLPRIGHVHREGLVAQRGDRPAAARRDPRAVRAPGRDHRRLGVVHLRPRRAGRLRRDGPARCGPAASTGATRCSATSWTSSTSATTTALDPRPVPGPRRHPRDPAGVVGGDLVRVEFFGDEVERITEIDPLTGELLAERKELNVYPATHFVTPARQAPARHRRHRGRDGGAGRPAGGRGPGARGGAAAPAHDVRPRDAARARLLHAASRTTRAT